MSDHKITRAKWLRDPRLQQLLTVLAQEGEGRIVGGAVRNHLLKRPVDDVDVATNLLPQAVARLCKAAGLGVHPTGIDHGTLTIAVAGKPFEVTTLRKDVQTDGRRAVVQYTDDWATDAARRDFTINALYADRGGKIYDFTKGYRDIQKPRVKFIGKPEHRIREDYLRILRFFRFHAQLATGKPDAAGLAACSKLARGLQTLSAERMRQEMLKLLAAEGAVAALKAMSANGILKHILSSSGKWRLLQRLPRDPLLRLYAIAEAPQDLQSTFKLSNADASRILALRNAPELSPHVNRAERQRMLYDIGPQTWRDAVHLNWARSKAPMKAREWRLLLNAANKYTRPTFPVTGHMLMKQGIAPGPAMGQALRDLEDWWVASDFKLSREELMAKLGR